MCTNVSANSRERYSYWNTHIFGSFATRCSSRVSLEIRKKESPCLISSRRGKKAFWNVPEHFVLLNTACPEEKLFNQNLTCWNILDNNQSGQRMTTSILTCSRLENKKYLTLGPSDHIAVNRGGDWVTFVRFTVQKHRLNKTKNPNLRARYHFTGHTPYATSERSIMLRTIQGKYYSKACLLQFFLATTYSCYSTTIIKIAELFLN